MRKYLVNAWTMIDPIYYGLSRLTYIHDPNEMFKNIFRVRLTSYKGAPLTLSDGTKINKNDVLLKIHLHNIRLVHEMQSMENEIHKARYIYNMVQQSLPGLAHYIQKHGKNEEIKGIIGITTLNKVVYRLGFEAFDIKNPIYRWWKLLVSLSILSVSTPTTSLSLIKKQQPKYIFISKDKLLHSYEENLAQ